MDHYLLRMHNCYNLLASASVFFDRNLLLSKEAFSCLAVLCLEQRSILKLRGSCAAPDLPPRNGGCALWAHTQQLWSLHQHCLCAVHTLLTSGKSSGLQQSTGQQLRGGSTFVRAVVISGISSCQEFHKHRGKTLFKNYLPQVKLGICWKGIMLITAAFEHFHATVSKNCLIFIVKKEKKSPFYYQG